MRRVLRIFPLYYGVLFVIFVVLPLFASVKSLDAVHIFDKQAWFWAYSMNIEMALQGGETYFRSNWVWIVHLWSLCIEEHFYLVWPFIVWLSTPSAILRVCAAVVVSAIAIRCGMTASHVEPWVIYTLTPCRIDSLVIGAALAVMARSPQQFAWLRRVAPWSLAGAVAYLALATVVAGHVVKFTHWTMTGPGFSVIAVGSASALVLALDAGDSGISRILEGPVLGTFGKYSYGAYVLHHLMLPVYARWTPFSWYVARVHFEVLAVVAQVTVETALSMAAATASWHLYEKHFLNMKRLFEYSVPAPGLEQRAHGAASSDLS
jgi:peptidoglycan/LPS O-acetylase OafA/YrhL